MSFKSDHPVVSIIIPCHNAHKWVQEAIESSLNQTYPNVEVVVVDDGSTDGSLAIIRRYLPRIKIETGPNRGGNNARNRGFAISTGAYIQYLDADDYLEADKIALQVRFLEETQADAVYGDFRYRRHLPDNCYSYLDRVLVSGTQPNLLASLLTDWGVNGGTVLYRRQVVDHVGGWDESMLAVQDTDFLTSVALSGADIRYQPGCHFVYRKYGNVTVSTSSLSRWLTGMCATRRKSELTLVRAGQLTEEYKTSLAIGYFETARAAYSFDPRASFAIYAKTLDDFVEKIHDLCPHFRPTETRAFVAVQSLFGLSFAMHLVFRVRAAINVIRSKLRDTFLFDLVLRMRRVNLERESDRRAARSSLTAP